MIRLFLAMNVVLQERRGHLKIGLNPLLVTRHPSLISLCLCAPVVLFNYYFCFNTSRSSVFSHCMVFSKPSSYDTFGVQLNSLFAFSMLNLKRDPRFFTVYVVSRGRVSLRNSFQVSSITQDAA